MLRRKSSRRLAAILLLAALAFAPCASAQKKSKKPTATTGGIVGRVRVDAGMSASEISVKVRQGDTEVAQTTTNLKGEFEVQGLAPGVYGLTLRKAGLQVGKMEDINVRAGKTVSLKDRLFLPIDEGALALVRGSVFNAEGRSFPGARVELARVEPDGTLKKLDDRVADVTGSFKFKLSPARALYRVTAKADGTQAATADVEVDGPAIYRVAVTLSPSK